MGGKTAWFMHKWHGNPKHVVCDSPACKVQKFLDGAHQKGTTVFHEKNNTMKN